MTNQSADHIIWIDCEMTGLNPDSDELIEIAVIITDSNLTPLDPGFEVVIKPSDAALAQMNSFVRNMHEVSGLLDKLASGVQLETAQKQLIDYVSKWRTKGSKPLVAGNSIGTDRRFISKQMPELEQLLHYRSIDVSSLKELARKWNPEILESAPQKHGNHRALGDIQDSIRELAHYKETFLRHTAV